MAKIPVAVLGATGLVGQRLVRRLVDHPWFEVVALTGSARSEGKRYADVVRWRLPGDPPPQVADMVVQPSDPAHVPAKLVFSALPSSIAADIEAAFAQAGAFVSSNARNYRMHADVPLVLPEVNPDHLALLHVQQRQRGWTGGIVTNANCVAIPLTLALKPLQDAFGVEQVFVVTMQAISGAGYPGVASLDIVDNVIPFISGEEPKIESEPLKMLGMLSDGTVEAAPIAISAQANRVATRDGHMLCVSVKLKQQATPAEVAEVLRAFRGKPQELNLPSAAPTPIVVREEDDRPQPVRDRDAAGGMAITVGRIRECPLFDVKFVVLGHNTERGAAAAALLNGELLKAEGFVA
ncbi:MAG: aspartate-semialdehyde dehydrogenase [Ardenticatenia bacterium]|nr:MAG: aspartate-semialdehyde dehydrogenase [Ardenticatenia bacterium]